MRKNITKSGKWILQPQEVEGNYMFSGNMFATSGIVAELTPEEIQHIIFQVKKRVSENNGADYLQVFKKNGKKIYVIDNLNREMISTNDKEYVSQNNYFTILFAFEY